MSLPSFATTSFSFLFTSFFVFFILCGNSSSSLAIHANTTRPPRQLSVSYYAKSCPQVEQLVGSVTSQQFKESPVSGPATIRLLFHDCFVGVRPIPTPSKKLFIFALACMHRLVFLNYFKEKCWQYTFWYTLEYTFYYWSKFIRNYKIS